MPKGRKGEATYKSMQGFRRRFFPASFERELVDSMDPRNLAVKVVKESLEEARRQLAQ